MGALGDPGDVDAAYLSAIDTDDFWNYDHDPIFYQGAIFLVYDPKVKPLRKHAQGNDFKTRLTLAVMDVET